MIPYELLLDADPDWAMSEESRHFEDGGAAQAALRKIALRLDALGIPYAIAGGMALFAHGLRRFTEDVDLLVTEEGLRQIAFPTPEAVSFHSNGISFLSLPTLIELKLASGMTNPQRVKDLADVQELIKLLALPTAFSAQLTPYVRPKFEELESATQRATKRFLRVWTAEFLTGEPKSMDAIVTHICEATATLQAMRNDGVTLEPAGGAANVYYLVTTDPAVASKYDMHEDSEFLD